MAFLIGPISVMPRRAEDRELALPAPKGNVPLQRWLYEEVRRAILNGRLKPGARLPATRDLAEQYGIARGTVTIAFEQLSAEGYLATGVGRGTYVEQKLPEHFLKAPLERPAEGAGTQRLGLPRLRLSKLGAGLARTAFPVAARTRIGAAFRAGQPDLAHFPMDVWTRIAARRGRASHRLSLADADACGYAPLRQEIASRMGTARGVTCTADEVVIVASVQQALDLIARLLLNPGDSVWVEEPGYPPARFVLEAVGARTVSIPVDAQGVDPEFGRLRCPAARLAVVTPARQAPLGVPLSLERRLALLQWASASGAFVFEDDYDGEYRFSERPLAALKSLDRDDRVIFAGTFSKVLFPALRLAYVVLPKVIMPHFLAAWSLTSRHVPLHTQMMLCDFMAEGHFGRHIRRMRKLYASRVEALETAARRHWRGVLELMPHDAGLDVAARALDHRLDDIGLIARATQAGLEILPLSPWFARAKSRIPGVVLGFASVAEKEIPEAARNLARIVTEHRGAR